MNLVASMKKARQLAEQHVLPILPPIFGISRARVASVLVLGVFLPVEPQNTWF